MAKEDIILGAGKLYYAAVGATDPDETSVAYDGSWGGSWTSLGNTLGPARVTIEEDRKKVFVEQRLGPVKSRRTRQEAMIRTILAEHTGVNLALLWGGANTDTAAGASQKAYSEILAGGQPVPLEKRIGLETVYVDSSGNKLPVRYFFHICTVQPDGELAIDKANETGIPIL